ncbi:M1 family aminopeptidase [Pedobacter africanus]|uniref:Tetratricopeptide (TPR) repeat protein n=1 Tax=Pedobacter africanus TaxID=151894 RepID=A0ACC6L455_9SPHI|nr:M1 family aminopeptidase [Pedobacter africanus]MDR6786274.1 tetratricopeptide (TPR) repeat protein [Pedobacter africanus]
MNYCNVVLSCLLMFSTFAYAQKKLQYRMQVKVDLEKKSFKVNGTLSFFTEHTSSKSVELVLTKGDMAPLIRLLNRDVAISKTDTSRNTAGDVVYCFWFSENLPADRKIEFEYQYERGVARSFQYFIDSTFCMAGGYGSAWYPQLNSPSEEGNAKCTRATGTISVTTAPEFTAVMAASTSAVENVANAKTATFTYAQPDIFSLYVGNYIVHKRNGPIPFYSFTLVNSRYDEEVAIQSDRVLSFLRTQFGPLKIPDFSIIELPDHVSEQTGIGGASLLGGILMPSNAIRRFNYALFGHELSHQWWGNLIMAKGDKGEALLSEGMAQYGSLQVVRHFDPEHAIDYRKKGYPGYISDQSGLGYLKNAAAGNDEPLTKLTGSNEHIIANSKGFLVMELLAQTIGRQKFNAALFKIADKYQKTGLNWENFKTEVSVAYGHDLEWFFRQWFEQTGVPEWEMNWKQQQNDVRVTVLQKGNVYKLPLDLLVTYENGARELKKVQINKKLNDINFPVKRKVISVKADPCFNIIHWEEEMKHEALALAMVSAVQKLRMDQQYAAAEKLAFRCIDSLSKSDRYGVEFALLYLLGRMKANQNKPEEGLDYYLKAVRCASRNMDYLAYAYFRIAEIAALKKDKDLFNWAVQQAIKVDELNNGNDHMQAMTDRLSF